MHNYNYVNTLWFGTVSFDSCSRFMLCLYCFVYYVYDNPTYEVANKFICILYLVSNSERMDPGGSFLYWTNSTDSESGEPRLTAQHSSCTVVGAFSIGATT